jgi:hypothetical protein
MKTITFKVYEFGELNEKAQQNVIERYRKDAVFKNENSVFNEQLKRSMGNTIIENLDEFLIFDNSKLKIKAIKDGKFKLLPDVLEKDDSFKSLYGDSENIDQILNAEYTINYDGKNTKSIKVVSNTDLGYSYAVTYYLAGVVGGTINWINGLIENHKNLKSSLDINEYVSGMLFHVDGSDLTNGEKMVIEERKLIE